MKKNSPQQDKIIFDIETSGLTGIYTIGFDPAMLDSPSIENTLPLVIGARSSVGKTSARVYSQAAYGRSIFQNIIHDTFMDDIYRVSEIFAEIALRQSVEQRVQLSIEKDHAIYLEEVNKYIRNE